MAQNVTWRGASNFEYHLELYPIGQRFNPVSGVYVFCRFTSLSQVLALYVGETDSLLDRLNTNIGQHDGFKRAQACGATHVAVLAVGNKTNGLQIETDLRQGLNPSCNAQGTYVRTVVKSLLGSN